MITKAEISVLMQSVSIVVKEYVAAALAGLSGRLEELDQRIKSIPAGAKGDPGSQGPAGEPGAPGRDGKDGEPGRDGVAGLHGKDGADGINGKDGARGPAGESIIGPSGPRGESGASGEKGESGLRGDRGEKGDPGTDGRDGRDGIAGKDGRDGESGRDALQVDILEAIDPAKSYPRGTFARHRGGLWRAKRSASSIEDWDCIIDGIASFRMSLSEDLRTFSFIVEQSSLEISSQGFEIPVMLYRDFFKDGQQYCRGDVITYGGSSWHCQADNTKSRPGTDDSWQLMVKEGRRGKDGKDGERGPEGPKGKDGRP